MLLSIFQARLFRLYLVGLPILQSIWIVISRWEDVSLSYEFIDRSLIHDVALAPSNRYHSTFPLSLTPIVI